VTALARPPEAGVIVHARPDLARAVGAQGVQLRRDDLGPKDARRVYPGHWIGVSVQDRPEAEAAIAAGADYLVAGTVWETASHPGRPARGLAWLRELCGLGSPVLAIGGVTPERALQARDAGAWGVAAVGALWGAADPASAALALVAPWTAET
jgi:thiamine-phosphate diphosphorylase